MEVLQTGVGLWWQRRITIATCSNHVFAESVAHGLGTRCSLSVRSPHSVTLVRFHEDDIGKILPCPDGQ